eukprot:CAMPEP_0169331800 /NCGR_PEP_ID=MMETSP1017-20121227/14380_1 /TAXON_ID=342587 /ORGANISM="Karlodinium micrum, Strain CCMP2283" /LENGTH=100 /DNA_ID=CAMNT_0009426901 /DNA_START=30 /DNA_END=328 /DNA_ORIENTATION=+
MSMLYGAKLVGRAARPCAGSLLTPKRIGPSWHLLDHVRRSRISTLGTKEIAPIAQGGSSCRLEKQVSSRNERPFSASDAACVLAAAPVAVAPAKYGANTL